MKPDLNQPTNERPSPTMRVSRTTTAVATPLIRRQIAKTKGAVHRLLENRWTPDSLRMAKPEKMGATLLRKVTSVKLTRLSASSLLNRKTQSDYKRVDMALPNGSSLSEPESKRSSPFGKDPFMGELFQSFLDQNQPAAPPRIQAFPTPRTQTPPANPDAPIADKGSLIRRKVEEIQSGPRRETPPAQESPVAAPQTTPPTPQPVSRQPASSQETDTRPRVIENPSPVVQQTPSVQRRPTPSESQPAAPAQEPARRNRAWKIELPTPGSGQEEAGEAELQRFTNPDDELEPWEAELGQEPAAAPAYSLPGAPDEGDTSPQPPNEPPAAETPAANPPEEMAVTHSARKEIQRAALTEALTAPLEHPARTPDLSSGEKNSSAPASTRVNSAQPELAAALPVIEQNVTLPSVDPFPAEEMVINRRMAQPDNAPVYQSPAPQPPTEMASTPHSIKPPASAPSAGNQPAASEPAPARPEPTGPHVGLSPVDGIQRAVQPVESASLAADAPAPAGSLPAVGPVENQPLPDQAALEMPVAHRDHPAESAGPIPFAQFAVESPSQPAPVVQRNAGQAIHPAEASSNPPQVSLQPNPGVNQIPAVERTPASQPPSELPENPRLQPLEPTGNNRSIQPLTPFQPDLHDLPVLADETTPLKMPPVSRKPVASPVELAGQVGSIGQPQSLEPANSHHTPQPQPTIDPVEAAPKLERALVSNEQVSGATETAGPLTNPAPMADRNSPTSPGYSEVPAQGTDQSAVLPAPGSSQPGPEGNGQILQSAEMPVINRISSQPGTVAETTRTGWTAIPDTTDSVTEKTTPPGIQRAVEKTPEIAPESTSPSHATGPAGQSAPISGESETLLAGAASPMDLVRRPANRPDPIQPVPPEPVSTGTESAVGQASSEQLLTASPSLRAEVSRAVDRSAPIPATAAAPEIAPASSQAENPFTTPAVPMDLVSRKADQPGIHPAPPIPSSEGNRSSGPAGSQSETGETSAPRSASAGMPASITVGLTVIRRQAAPGTGPSPLPAETFASPAAPESAGLPGQLPVPAGEFSPAAPVEAARTSPKPAPEPETGQSAARTTPPAREAQDLNPSPALEVIRRTPAARIQAPAAVSNPAQVIPAHPGSAPADQQPAALAPSITPARDLPAVSRPVTGAGQDHTGDHSLPNPAASQAQETPDFPMTVLHRETARPGELPGQAAPGSNEIQAKRADQQTPAAPGSSQSQTQNEFDGLPVFHFQAAPSRMPLLRRQAALQHKPAGPAGSRPALELNKPAQINSAPSQPSPAGLDLPAAILPEPADSPPPSTADLSHNPAALEFLQRQPMDVVRKAEASSVPVIRLPASGPISTGGNEAPAAAFTPQKGVTPELVQSLLESVSAAPAEEGYVQREVTESRSLQRAVEMETAPEIVEMGEETAGSGSIDIKALARQIYPLIKRMLAVEKERLTGRSF